MTDEFDYPTVPGVDPELKRRIVEAIQGYDSALVEVALGHLLGATVALSSNNLGEAHEELDDIAKFIKMEVTENWDAIVARRTKQ